MRLSGLVNHIFGLTFALIFFLQAAAPAAAGQGVVTIVENDWPPYYFGGKPGTPAGIAKELLLLCLPETGYTPSFNFYPVKRMYAYLEKGLIDIAVFSHKKERESFLLYGKEPLFSSGYRPVVRAGSNIRIAAIKDFDGLRLGHLAGLRYSKAFKAYVEQRERAGTLVTATTGDSCLRMLLAGMIDVFVDTEDTVLWRAKQADALGDIKILDFDIRTSPYYVTVSRQSAGIEDKALFLNRLDETLRAAKKDGRYAAIVEKYGRK